ncbi:hypothetical protein D3C87_1384290 [compost metagenome]
MNQIVYILFECPNDYESDPIIVGVYNSYDKAASVKEGLIYRTEAPYHCMFDIDEYVVE